MFQASSSVLSYFPLQSSFSFALPVLFCFHDSIGVPPVTNQLSLFFFSKRYPTKYSCRNSYSLIELYKKSNTYHRSNVLGSYRLIHRLHKDLSGHQSLSGMGNTQLGKKESMLLKNLHQVEGII